MTTTNRLIEPLYGAACWLTKEDIETSRLCVAETEARVSRDLDRLLAPLQVEARPLDIRRFTARRDEGERVEVRAQAIVALVNARDCEVGEITSEDWHPATLRNLTFVTGEERSFERREFITVSGEQLRFWKRVP